MADVLFLLIVLAFFAVSIAAMAACERLAGRGDGSDGETDPEVASGR